MSIADFDFETYSEAGYVWTPERNKWERLPGADKYGLQVVGACVYSEHASTEAISAAYDLKEGLGKRLWVPGMENPLDLFEYLAAGGLLEAHNCGFEFWIWLNVMTRRYGWPQVDYKQFRCSMAKARAWSLPGALGKIGNAIELKTPKDKEGKTLIKFFCIPRNPTKTNQDLRNLPVKYREKAADFYRYNIRDIEAEAEVSDIVPDLNPEELTTWQHTFLMNLRGIQIDKEAVDAAIIILEQVYTRYEVELNTLTDGAVPDANKTTQLKDWIAKQGYFMPSFDKLAVQDLLESDPEPPVKRALEIRQLTSSAGVKKLYAMQRQMCRVGRVHDLFFYHGARTGRDTGADVQPQNLVKKGPALRWCEEDTCKKPYGAHLMNCPFCGASEIFSKPSGWKHQATDTVIEVLKSGSLDYVEQIYGDATLAISGCIRGMFVAKEGHNFICSDYSSIEAVVAAVISGEQWRIDTFHRREDIYLKSCESITGKSLAWYATYKAEHDTNHPDRQKIGKVAELGLGFGGWIGAWRQFDDTDTYTDEEVKKLILKWREASPAIVEMWGGQVRGKPWAPTGYELYGLEGAAIAAVQNPGVLQGFRSICYHIDPVTNILYCTLPSGRRLTYHAPRLGPSDRWADQLSLSFEGYNTNQKMGAIGWIRIETYGGRLFENVVQAIARDLLMHVVPLLEAAGYSIVLRVHDELVAEIPEGFGSIEEFERLMSTLPTWATGWPVRAHGGWIGKRYRKD